LILNVLFLLTFIGLLVAAVVVLDHFRELWPGQAQGIMPGFIVGLLVGASLGGVAAHIGEGFVRVLSMCRSERLLVQYYDALRESHPDPTGTAASPSRAARNHIVS
jgi:hypothetical protein